MAIAYFSANWRLGERSMFKKPGTPLGNILSQHLSKIDEVKAAVEEEKKYFLAFTSANQAFSDSFSPHELKLVNIKQIENDLDYYHFIDKGNSLNGFYQAVGVDKPSGKMIASLPVAGGRHDETFHFDLSNIYLPSPNIYSRLMFSIAVGDFFITDIIQHNVGVYTIDTVSLGENFLFYFAEGDKTIRPELDNEVLEIDRSEAGGAFMNALMAAKESAGYFSAPHRVISLSGARLIADVLKEIEEQS